MYRALRPPSSSSCPAPAMAGPKKLSSKVLALPISVSVNVALIALILANRRGLPLQESVAAVPAAAGGNVSSSPAAAVKRPAFPSDAVVNFDHGDPTMYEAYWEQAGDGATITIPGWQTMSYFSDVSSVCWFLEPAFAHEVRRLHGLVGNAAAEGRHVVVGVGSTQLFQAALYALSPPDAAEPMPVVSAPPYYSSYPTVTDYLRSGLFRWAGAADSFRGDKYIELVCSPSNPAGHLTAPVLRSELGKTVYDLAYYWPQYTPIVETADHDIMLFTVSKTTGHAGTRLGWAVVKDREVARKMTKFIELNTIGVSKDSQLRAARILKTVSDGYGEASAGVNGSGIKFFEFARSMMVSRWERLRNAVAASGQFALPEFSRSYCLFAGEDSDVHPAFAWLRCTGEGKDDCAAYLRSHKIITRSGVHFGAGADYVRVSMLDREEAFELFITRLSSLS